MFHDLITQMLNVDPTCRPSTTQVTKHTRDFLAYHSWYCFQNLVYEDLASSSKFTINRELVNSALIYLVPVCVCSKLCSGKPKFFREKLHVITYVFGQNPSAYNFFRLLTPFDHPSRAKRCAFLFTFSIATEVVNLHGAGGVVEWRQRTKKKGHALLTQ